MDLGQPIADYVKNLINIRQQTHGSGASYYSGSKGIIDKLNSSHDLRTDEQLLLLNTSTSWLRLASGVSVSESKLTDLGIFSTTDIEEFKGRGLAKNHVLFGGISSLKDKNTTLSQRDGFLNLNSGGDREINPNPLNNEVDAEKIDPLSQIFTGAYETSQDWGIVPMPGLISADIKALSMGSVKKATVKFIVNNREQLAILDVLYLRLGYTVLLEWGNSIYQYYDHKTKESEVRELESTLIDDGDTFFKENNGLSYFDFLDLIEKKREEYQGNYDALLGKITNFNWSFNNDGAYEIEITLLSLGDIVESLSTNIVADSKTLEAVQKSGFTDETTVFDKNRLSNIINSMLHILKLQNYHLDNWKNSTAATITTTKGSTPSTSYPGVLCKVEDKFIKVSSYTARIAGNFGAYSSGWSDGTKKYDANWLTYDQILSEDTSNYNETYKTPVDFFAWIKEEGTDKGFSNSWMINNNAISRQLFKAEGVWIGFNTQENIDKANAANPLSTKSPQSQSIQNPITGTTPIYLKYPLHNLMSSRETIYDNYIYKDGTLRFLDPVIELNISLDYRKNPNKIDPILRSYRGTAQVDIWFILIPDANQNSTTSPMGGTRQVHPDYQRFWNMDEKENAKFQGVFTIEPIVIFKRPKKLGYKVFEFTKEFNETAYNQYKSNTGPIATWKDEFDKAYPQKKEKIDDPRAAEVSFEDKIFKLEDNVVIPNVELFQKFLTHKGGNSDGIKGVNLARQNIDQQYGYNLAYGVLTDGDKMTVNKIKGSSTSISNPWLDLSPEYDINDAFVLLTQPSEYYIRFGFLLNLLKQKVITKVENTTKKHKDKDPIIDVDNGVTSMLCLNNQISFDWRKCIVSRNNFKRNAATNEKVDAQDIFPQLKSWVIDEGKQIADAMNVYLNFNFIASCLEQNQDVKGNVSIYKFISSLCDGINISLGGVNNLEPIVNEIKNRIEIIDTTPNQALQTNSNSYTLNLFGYDQQNPKLITSNFARKVDLKTAITPDYAMMIAVGATAGGYVKGIEATAFARWNQGISDSFKFELIAADNSNLTVNATNPGEKIENADIIKSFETIIGTTVECFGIGGGGSISETFPKIPGTI